MTTVLDRMPCCLPVIVQPDRMPVADGTRREFLASAALTSLLLGGCGDDGGDASRGGERITVRHVGGTTTFDALPERVVILDDAMLGDVLAFDVVPVGTAAAAKDPTVIEQWREEAGVAHIRNVAPDFTPNLEAIAAVRPDVILAMAFQVKEDYWTKLQAIAPTVAVETDVNPDALRPRFDEVALRTYAQVFRRPEIADRVLATYRDRVDELAERFADVIEGRTISLATNQDGQLRYDIDRGWGGAVLADIGFTFPRVQRAHLDKEFPVRGFVSAEQTMRYLSSDVVLWSDPADRSLRVRRGFPRAEVRENPLLERVPAARAGRVFTVSNRVWFLRTVRGRLLLLDQLEQEILPALGA